MKTSLFLTCTLLILSIFCFHLAAQDNAQIGLPEDTIARIGKGSLGQIHFSPDGSKLAVSTSIGIWIHDPQTGKELDLLRRSHIARPYIFAFSPDGKIIASTSWGKPKTSGRGINGVEVWDVTTGEDKAILIGHRMRVNSIAYSPDGETIATGGGYYDNTVRLWHAQTGQNISTSRMQTKWGTFVIFSPDGTTYAAAGDDNLVHLWNGKTGEHKITLTGHTKHVIAAAYSPDGKTIATSSRDGTIRLWDATTGNHKTTLTSNKESITSIGYSPDGNTIVCGTVNGNVQLWNTQTTKLMSTLTGHTEKVRYVVYSPDGETIATASSDNTVRLWDSTTGKTKVTLTGYMRISTVAYSPDGRTIATGSRDDKVRLWDAQTGKIKTTFTVSKNRRIGLIAYSPDGETIAVARPYDTVFLLDTRTGKRKTALKHFSLVDAIINGIQDREYSISSLAYSSDGKTIVTGLDCYTHEKGTLYLWNAKTGKRKRVLYKGKGGVSTAVFSEDSKKIIATGEWQKKTRVWHAETGKELTPTAADMSSGSKRLLHSPDGTTTAQVRQNGTVLIRKRETTLQKK